MTETIKTKSRRKTPWTEASEAAPLESYIDAVTGDDYSYRHPSLRDSGEAEFLNSIPSAHCRHCGSERFVRNGTTAYGVHRYKCKDCGKSFTLLTNTIFDSHKLPISQWMGYLLDIFSFGSLNLSSKVNRNSINTTRYWRDKTFLLLDGIQDDIVLSGEVWLDETFFKVRVNDIENKSDCLEYRGLSRNQICIGVACDKDHSIFIVEGFGKTSKRRTLEAFGKHITEGSTLIHDKEKAHEILVSQLSLSSIAYDSKDLKGMDDDANPLDPVNELCRLLKLFLRAHSGFIRDDLQGYLNLFHVIMNPPENKYEKVKKILELGLEKSVLLRYRDQKP